MAANKTIPIVAVVLLALAGFAMYLLLARSETHHLLLAAGPSTSEAYVLTTALGEVVSKHHADIKIEVVSTSGPNENMRLLERGIVDLATVQATTLPQPSARLVAELYDDAFQLVARRDAQIDSVVDIAGRRIALPLAEGQRELFWFLARQYQLSPESMQTASMSTEAANFALLNGSVDAIFRLRAPGNATILELITNAPTRLIEISQGTAMRLRQPAIRQSVVPHGSYRGNPPAPKSDLPTPSVRQLLLARDSLDNDAVAAITATLFERRRDLAALTPLAGFVTLPEQGSGTFVPLHAGAVQFYDRERPSFLQENAEPLALVLSILAVLGSGLLALKSRWDENQKGRVDHYNNTLIEIYEQTPALATREAVDACRARLQKILTQVVHDLDIDRVTSDGFESFSFAFQTVDAALRERRAELKD